MLKKIEATNCEICADSIVIFQIQSVNIYSGSHCSRWPPMRLLQSTSLHDEKRYVADSVFRKVEE